MSEKKVKGSPRAGSKKRRAVIAGLLISVAILLCVGGCGCDAKEDGGPDKIGVFIEKVRTGSFPNWCAANDLITFTDKLGGRYEVFTMQPDGSDVRCLTADAPALQGCGNRGQSSWHPSGDYIVFSAENAAYDRSGLGASARPGWGRNFNVWIMSADGKEFFRMTDYPENWAVMEAKFSHDGSKVFWCEEHSMEKYPNGKEGDLLLPGDEPTGPPYGHPGAYHSREQFTYRVGEEMLAWRIVYADISFGGDGPVMTALHKIDPPPGYTLNEANGFTPDDDGFIGCYSVLAETGGRAYAGELFACDLEGNLQQRLTDTVHRHDEDPCYSPGGDRIAYKETKGIVGYEDDLYLVGADGTGRIQLTHFADPGYPEYDPIYVRNTENDYDYVPSGTQITEMCFSPDGRQIVFGHCIAEEGSYEAVVDVPSYLYLFTLPE